MNENNNNQNQEEFNDEEYAIALNPQPTITIRNIRTNPSSVCHFGTAEFYDFTHVRTVLRTLSNALHIGAVQLNQIYQRNYLNMTLKLNAKNQPLIEKINETHSLIQKGRTMSLVCSESISHTSRAFRRELIINALRLCNNNINKARELYIQMQETIISLLEERVSHSGDLLNVTWNDVLRSTYEDYFNVIQEIDAYKSADNGDQKVLASYDKPCKEKPLAVVEIATEISHDVLAHGKEVNEEMVSVSTTIEDLKLEFDELTLGNNDEVESKDTASFESLYHQ